MPSSAAPTIPAAWDYLILTASNDQQAATYEAQLSVRQRLGQLPEVGTVMVVADPQGRRVGSGGSTLYCLMQVLAREVRRRGDDPLDWRVIEDILRRLRILIIHAGGDSRRVPAYGPCGKIFSPVPGPSTLGKGTVPFSSDENRDSPPPTASPVPITTLFDRLFPLFRDLPPGLPGAGQVVVTAGDALMRFDPTSVRLDRPGIVALGAYATPEAASKHGVFCVQPNGEVRLFLQKPTRDDQVRYGAINPNGQTILDIAVMSFDAASAVAMFRAFDVVPGPTGPTFSPAMEQIVLDRGLDLYREISCALGSEATAEHHRTSAEASGSTWPADRLAAAHAALSKSPLSVQVLPQCTFLHFGTTRQLITSGLELLQYDLGARVPDDCLSINNRCSGEGRIEGGTCWVEGCRLAAPLRLAGQNVVVGVDVQSPLELPRGACLDVIPGKTRDGRPIWFVRCYDLADTFKDTLERGGTLLGRPILAWLDAVGASPEQVWDPAVAPAARSLWDARVFPATDAAAAYRDWLWMFSPAEATAAQKRAFLDTERYSVAEMAVLADLEAFYQRRTQLCGGEKPCDMR